MGIYLYLEELVFFRTRSSSQSWLNIRITWGVYSKYSFLKLIPRDSDSIPLESDCKSLFPSKVPRFFSQSYFVALSPKSFFQPHKHGSLFYLQVKDMEKT